MAKIVINEISNTFAYNVGNSSFATVALPITAAWGPGYVEPATLGDEVTRDDVLESTVWQRFPATQQGMEAFVATYRGPAANFRIADDYSYQMAMTLMTAGYDVLVCRLCPGTPAEGAFYPISAISYTPVAEQPADWGKANYYKKVTEQYVIISKKPDDWDTGYTAYYKKNDSGEFESLAAHESFAAYKFYKKIALDEPIYEVVERGTAFEANKYFKQTLNETKKLVVKAKYPGTFGNNIRVSLSKVPNRNYYNLVTYAVEASGTRKALENLIFVFDIADATDTILHIDEIESNFVELIPVGMLDDNVEFNEAYVELTGGSDRQLVSETKTAKDLLLTARAFAFERFKAAGVSEPDKVEYVTAYDDIIRYVTEHPTDFDTTRANVLLYLEWLYTNVPYVYDLLKDKLSYSPQRIISPGWDDQNISMLTREPYMGRLSVISPIHVKLLDVGYYSRCATALVDIPKCLKRSEVYNETSSNDKLGYAQLLSRYQPTTASIDVNMGLYQTHAALFAPWGQYTYVGMGKKCPAPPSFLALLIQRAMILNQSAQFEWALPTTRKHNVDIGKLDYTIGKKQLDSWQKLDGVGVNLIANIPNLGTTLWGNSTLFEVPPASYQALANLSTRYLVNAVEDLVYRCGIQITFQYNNNQAYSAFYAGVTPLLDSMKNVGAIDDYRVKMASDVDGLDQVNANSVLGQIYLVINGVINDITVDLVCCPPGTDLSQFAE